MKHVQNKAKTSKPERINNGEYNYISNTKAYDEAHKTNGNRSINAFVDYVISSLIENQEMNN